MQTRINANVPNVRIQHVNVSCDVSVEFERQENGSVFQGDVCKVSQ